MGIITKIEEKLAEIVEKPFKGKKGVDPLSIEIALKKKIEAKRKNVLDKTGIPNKYSVIFDEPLYKEYEPFLDEMNGTLQKSLSDWMKEKGYEMYEDMMLEFKKGELTGSPFSVHVSYGKTERRENTDEDNQASAESSCPESTERCRLPNSRPDGAAKHWAKASGNLHEPKLPKGHESKQPTPAPLPRGDFRDNDKLTEKRSEIIGRLTDQRTGNRYPVYSDGAVIGREMNCDIRVEDPAVSERHARISFNSGKFSIEDLGSSNGTRVNRQRVKDKVLSDGDRIKIGEKEFIFTSL